MCASLLHFQFANEYDLARKEIKYLAFNTNQFKYPYRAFLCCSLNIISVLAIEVVNVYYTLCFHTTIDLITNFIKLKIVASFDDFFVEPFKQSSMAGFISCKFEIQKFRKDKIVVTQQDIAALVKTNSLSKIADFKMDPYVKILSHEVKDLNSKLNTFMARFE